MTSIPRPAGHHVWARAEALLRRERQGGPAANMDEVVWLWETAKRIRQETPEPVRISVSAEEADALWREAGAMLRRLMASDGTHEEWSAVYNLFLTCDSLERGDPTIEQCHTAVHPAEDS